MLYQGARFVCAIAILGALMGCDEISQPQSQSQLHVHQPDESGPGGVEVRHDTHSADVKHDWWHQHQHWEGYNLRHEHVYVFGEEHDPPASWRNPPAPAPAGPGGTAGPDVDHGPKGHLGIESEDGNSKSWKPLRGRFHGWSDGYDTRRWYADFVDPSIRSKPFRWDRITGQEQSICITIGGAKMDPFGYLLPDHVAVAPHLPLPFRSERVPYERKRYDPVYLPGTHIFHNPVLGSQESHLYSPVWTVAAEVSAGAIVLVFIDPDGPREYSATVGCTVTPTTSSCRTEQRRDHSGIRSAIIAIQERELIVSLGQCAPAADGSVPRTP